MKIVSEMSDSELAEARALKLIRGPLRKLACNIIRVVRGAGKAWEIAAQAVAVLESFEEYRSIVGHYPSDYEIREALLVREEPPSGPRDREIRWSYAIEDIIAGSLQMAASRLAGQPTQERAGESEMFKGFYEIEKIREENWKELNSSPRGKRKKT